MPIRHAVMHRQVSGPIGGRANVMSRTGEASGHGVDVDRRAGRGDG